MRDIILVPRRLDYVVQFTGPTGANAVEAALKLARKVTGRTNVVGFTNAFHGVSGGALSLTGNQYFRQSAGQPLSGATHMPFDGYFGEGVDTIAYLERMLDDPSSGIDLPAAVILETVQGEGGLNTQARHWLRRLQQLCNKQNVSLDRRRHSGRLRANGRILQFRVRRLEARHCHFVEVLVRLRPSDVGRLDPPRPRCLEARSTQRHVPRQQPRFRDRDGRAAPLLVHARFRSGLGGQEPASAAAPAADFADLSVRGRRSPRPGDDAGHSFPRPRPSRAGDRRRVRTRV